jgi:hypothetical protein
MFQKQWIMKILYIIFPQVKTFTLYIYLKISIQKKINFPTLFYMQPQQFSKGFSYQQIVQWELLYKSGVFPTNILNMFLKLLKFTSKK